MASVRVLDPAEEAAQRSLLYGSQMAVYVADSQQARRCRKPLATVSASAKSYADAMTALRARIQRAAEASVSASA